MLNRSLTPSLITSGEGWLLITFAGYSLLISFLTRGGPFPSLINLAIGDLVYLKPSTRMVLDSAVDIYKPQPRTFGPWKVYVNIVHYFSSSNTIIWNAYPNIFQMIIYIVLIVVIFLGLINHIME
jgi:hypothetical protein